MLGPGQTDFSTVISMHQMLDSTGTNLEKCGARLVLFQLSVA